MAAIVSWGFEAAGGEEHRVDDRNRLHASVSASVGEFIGVLNEAKVIDLREDDCGDLTAELCDAGLDGSTPDTTRFFFGRKELEFHRDFSAVCAENFEVTWEEVRCDEDGVALGHTDGTDGGFEEGAGAIVEGGIDRFETGELGEGGLVDPVRDERALRAFGLVGRVGSREVTDRADVSDDLMRPVDLETVAEEARLGVVTLGECQHAVGEGGVFELVWEVELPWELHVACDVRVHLAELRRADSLEHRLDVRFARRDVVPGEFA